MKKAKLNKSEGKLETEDENSVDKTPEFTENKTEENVVEENKKKSAPIGPKKAENPSTEAERAASCPTEAEKVQSITDEPIESKSSVTELKRTGSIPTSTSEARNASNSDGFPVRRRSSRIAETIDPIAEKNIQEAKNNTQKNQLLTKRKASPSPEKLNKTGKKIRFNDEKRVISC